MTVPILLEQPCNKSDTPNKQSSLSQIVNSPVPNLFQLVGKFVTTFNRQQVGVTTLVSSFSQSCYSVVILSNCNKVFAHSCWQVVKLHSKLLKDLQQILWSISFKDVCGLGDNVK